MDKIASAAHALHGSVLAAVGDPVDASTVITDEAAKITLIVSGAIVAGLAIWALSFGVKVGINKFAGWARKG